LTVDLRRSPAPPATGGRVPPQNLEAEASVLGSLMLDRNAVVRVADFLRPEDFYLDHHAQVFRAALNLYDRADPIDLLTLAAELEKMLVLERIGGQAFLAELESGVPTAANVEYYGHLVEEAATKRKLISAGGRITSLGFDESTPASQALDTAESVIFNIAEGRITQDFVALKDILKTTWDQIEQIHKDQSVISGVPPRRRKNQPYLEYRAARVDPIQDSGRDFFSRNVRAATGYAIAVQRGIGRLLSTSDRAAQRRRVAAHRASDGRALRSADLHR
jgi:hypothetical protein